MHYYYKIREPYIVVDPIPTEPTVGDVRSLSDVNQTTSPDMGPQRLGRAIVRSGRIAHLTLSSPASIITTVDGPDATSDPNNLVAKYGSRWDETTFYRKEG